MNFAKYVKKFQNFIDYPQGVIKIEKQFMKYFFINGNVWFIFVMSLRKCYNDILNSIIIFITLC